MKATLIAGAIALAACDRPHPGRAEPRAPTLDGSLTSGPDRATAPGDAAANHDARAVVGVPGQPGDTDAGGATATGETPDAGIQLTWSIRRAGNALHIRYAVRNASAAPVVLLDQLTEGGVEPRPAFDRVIVRDGDQPGVVSFARAEIAGPPGVGVAVATPAAARALAPGATIVGAAVVPLPLTGWYPSGPWHLRGTPTRAYLEIGYLAGAVDLTDLTLADGSTIDVVTRDAHTPPQRFARSDALAIP